MDLLSILVIMHLLIYKIGETSREVLLLLFGDLRFQVFSITMKVVVVDVIVVVFVVL